MKTYPLVTITPALLSELLAGSDVLRVVDMGAAGVVPVLLQLRPVADGDYIVVGPYHCDNKRAADAARRGFEEEPLP